MRVPASAVSARSRRQTSRPLEAGHLHVEEDQVGPRGTRDLQGLHAVRGLEHADLLILERESHQLQDGRLVVHHQDGRHAVAEERTACQMKPLAKSARLTRRAPGRCPRIVQREDQGAQEAGQDRDDERGTAGGLAGADAAGHDDPGQRAGEGGEGAGVVDLPRLEPCGCRPDSRSSARCRARSARSRSISSGASATSARMITRSGAPPRIRPPPARCCSLLAGAVASPRRCRAWSSSAAWPGSTPK